MSDSESPEHWRATREIYRERSDGSVQLGAGSNRWHLYADYVHVAPHHTREGLMMRYQAEPLPFVDNINRQALVIVDMQNDFCAPGGWTDASGLDYQRCRQAIPGVQRALEVARQRDMWVIWVYWDNERFLRNLGAPTLFSFRRSLDQTGIGQELKNGSRVLTDGSWGTEIVEELASYVGDDDTVIKIPKVRMSAFYGTHLDQVLRTQGINTLFLTGVNTDQCVQGTLQDAYFRDYTVVLLSDATATCNPDFCKEALLFNTKTTWGFLMDTRQLAAAQRLSEHPT